MKKNKLLLLIKEANEIRKSGSTDYVYEEFYELSYYIRHLLDGSFLKERNAQIVVDLLDEILPFIVDSNNDILLLHSKILMKKTGFKGKFRDGLRKYPYNDGILGIIEAICENLDDRSDAIDRLFDHEILEVLAMRRLDSMSYEYLLNRLNEANQMDFLYLLAEYKCVMPLNSIVYKGNNKQKIIDNIECFMENVVNLYSLMNFVSDDSLAYAKVKNYIDSHEEKAINSIFCELSPLLGADDPTIQGIIRLAIIDVVNNEGEKLSDITFNRGGYSRVLIIGEKVIKVGNRRTKRFPNNPYIVAPIIRKSLVVGAKECFIEATECVETNIMVSEEDLYQLFRNLRNLGIVWTDVQSRNVGRLKRDNIIHWKRDLNPSDEVLGLDPKRGNIILKAGELVILDADYFYDEKDSNIIIPFNSKALYVKFNERYLNERQTLGNWEYSDSVIDLEPEAGFDGNMDRGGAHL